MDNATSGGTPDGSFDIASILTGTSDSSDTTGQGGGLSAGQGAPQGTQEFKFGGRSYPSQSEAERAHNQLYGKYSESQGILKQLKEALKDPKKVAQLSKDPQFSTILSKLGIQAAEEEFEAEEEAEEREAGARGQESDPLREIGALKASISLEREVNRFEKKLGRDLSDEEHDSVMNVIGRAPTLSFEEAWKLANHDKLMQEAARKAAQTNRGTSQRPPPTPGLVPGIKLDLKKPVSDMSPAEWREHLKQSDEFKNLMSR